ncbi:hypothetical protein SRHO_G00161160 [Serrasalmus rhombeus]
MDTQTELLRKFEKRIEENTAAIIENKENIELLRKKVSELLEENKRLKESVTEQARYKRRWNLRLNGLAEKDGEDTREVVIGILTRVVPISVERLRETVDIVHRLDLKDLSGIDVDSDIFDELVKSSQVSFVVSTEESSVLCTSSDERQSSSESSFCSEDSASSGSTLILESTKARRRQLIDGPVDLTTARDIVKLALHSKPGGDQIFQEYLKTSGLSDGTRRKMVNILADMVEGYRRIPDLDSVDGYEHYYDPQTGSGYLVWRLKTVQRNSASEGKSGSTSSYKGGPKTHREMPVCGEQLSDTTGLVAQDFTLLFGEEVSGRFLAKWPTIFKPKIIADCKTIHSNSHMDDLLALALQESVHGWHSDLACILLLLHLLFPTSKGKKMGKISASEAEDRLVKFMRV